MSPKYMPKEKAALQAVVVESAASKRAIRAEGKARDAEFESERAQKKAEQAKERRKDLMLQVYAKTPYGPQSPHSWLRDRAAMALDWTDPMANQRLNEFRAAMDREERAVSSSTLGGLIPATIPPYVAEAVAYGLRSTAPLALALERLDLPPVGTSVPWAKVTTAATVTNQTAENAALTASADPVVGSVTDALKTIGAYVDFSAQSQELSGGWFDRVIGEDLGRAFGARLESQLWSGSGSSGQITGFTIMSGTSSSTVAGQTLANQTAKISDQYQQVSNNLGAPPDLIAMAPRRYASLHSLAAALGLSGTNVIPQNMQLVASPAAPTNLGAGTNEDWVLLINRASTPLVRDPNPNIEVHQQGPSAGTNLTFRLLIYAYVALGVSRRPEGVGLVKGGTAPSF